MPEFELLVLWRFSSGPLSNCIFISCCILIFCFPWLADLDVHVGGKF